MRAEAVVADLAAQYALYIAMLDLQPGARVLEAGCGAGRALVIAADQVPQSRWIGLDRLPHLLRQVHATHAQIPLVLADLRQLPFAAGALDAVFSRDTLECLPDPVAHLDECARVLRGGGQLLLSHWDWSTPVFDCADPALSGNMVRAYANTPQDWMEHHDPAMGPKLRGLVGRHPMLHLIKAGVTELVDSDWRPGRFGYELAQSMAKFLPARGVVAGGDSHRWLELLERAAAIGEYRFCAHHHWCLAEKHAGNARL